MGLEYVNPKYAMLAYILFWAKNNWESTGVSKDFICLKIGHKFPISKVPSNRHGRTILITEDRQSMRWICINRINSNCPCHLLAPLIYFSSNFLKIYLPSLKWGVSLSYINLFKISLLSETCQPHENSK